MKKIIIAAAVALNTTICMAQTDWTTNPIGSIFAQQGSDTPQGTYKMTSGGYDVYTIASADKDYQPATLYYGTNDADKAKIDRMAPDGKVPTAMNCFVVKTPEGYIMFDTGLPSARGGKTRQRLEALNIHSDDIKAIYLTHGHFDHIGGLLDEQGKAEYRNATVYVAATEMAFIRESMAEAAQQIEKAYADRIVTFGPGEILPGNVLPIDAKGHTPGHTAYQLGTLLFAGDLMHGAALQLIDPTICANFDADREQAIANRIRILEYAAANSLTILGAHIPNNGVIF